jgi:peroxiredoxin
MKSIALLTCTILGVLSAPASEAPPEAVSVPIAVAENFRLLDHTGRSVELYRAADAPAVVLYTHGVGCPIVRNSVPELNRIREEFSEAGVVFYMLNANSQDARVDIVADISEYGISMPILKDPTQRIVKSLGSTRTAEVLVLDPQEKWKILYRGPVDDRFNYGTQKEVAENRYLETVLKAHLAGEAIVPRTVETKGCLISFGEDKPVSYASEVAPILQAKCVNCHSEGGIGPFAMSSYKKVAGWADMIRETLRTDRMPPWHADPEHKTFHNSLDLSVEESRTLMTWVEQGAKQESADDPLATYTVAHDSNWTLGEPDHIVQLPEPHKLPASGVLDYVYVNVPSGLTEDKWLRGVEVIPTAMEAVHHALIFIMYPREYRHVQPDPKGGLDGFFASYLPGGNIQAYPKGTAQFVPAGSTFVFQMHYNTVGKAVEDQTRMALYYHDGPPPEVLHIRAATETEFEIPPNAPDHVVESGYRFRDDATLLGLSPHMHYRGSRFRFDATYPDEKKETLLSVPWYEFDWQPMYYLDQPIPMPKGTRIQCEGAFDNSRFNPRNPDPNASVTFGEQSHEEMFIGYLSYSQPYKAEDFKPQDPNPDKWAGYGKPLTAETLTGTTWQMGRRFKMRFEAGGKLVINDEHEGAWELKGEKLELTTGFRDVTAEVAMDEIFIDGRPLTRIPAGTAAVANPQ